MLIILYMNFGLNMCANVSYMQQLHLATNLSLHFPHKHKQLFIQPPHQVLVLKQVLHPTKLPPIPSTLPLPSCSAATWLCRP